MTGRDCRLKAVATDTASWSDHNGMQLNVDRTKTTIVSFSRKRPPDPEDIPPLTIGGKELEKSPVLKCLG